MNPAAFPGSAAQPDHLSLLTRIASTWHEAVLVKRRHHAIVVLLSISLFDGD